MDYKEAYDDICQKLMSAYNTTSFIEVKKAIGQIHPELAESEDEKIRKEIISLVLKVMGQEKDNFSDDKYNAMLAWLEKQKEEEGYDFIPVKSTLEYKLGFTDGRDSEKQKEQKFSELSTNDKAFIKDCARILDENYYTESAKRLLSMLPAKPAEWSEEDEKMRKSCLWVIEHQKSYTGVEDEKAWLKSLHPQPKQEWNGEDEKHIDICIKALKEMEMQDSEDFSTTISFLKSLRPSWKPTEEQMNAIDRCVDYLEESDNEDAEIMESLQEQLHKLM